MVIFHSKLQSFLLLEEVKKKKSARDTHHFLLLFTVEYSGMVFLIVEIELKYSIFMPP